MLMVNEEEEIAKKGGLVMSIKRERQRDFSLMEHRLCVVLFIFLILILSIFWDSLRQYTFLYTLQELQSRLLTIIFQVFTFLGDDEFFMLFIPVIYWTISKTSGIKLAMVLLFSSMFTFLLKDMTQLPRPDIGVHSLTDNTFPSGHTLTAVTVWGYLAYQLRDRIVTLVAIFIILMVGFSRLYFAYHFPGDILGGLLFGGLFLSLFLYIEHKIPKKLSPTFTTLLLLSILGPLLLSMFSPRPDYIKVLAFLSGSVTGYLLETQFLNVHRRALLWQQIVKSLIGLVVLFAIVLGLGLLFPASSSLLRFIRYGLAGIWVTLLWPWCFMRLRLYTT